MVAMMKCFVKCLNGSHPIIEVFEDAPVSLGRGPLTKIKDVKCSRKQIELTADFTTQTVQLVNTGASPITVEGKVLNAKSSCTLKAGDTFGLVGENYPHTVYFEAEDSDSDSKKVTKTSRKRNIKEYFSESPSKKASPNKKKKSIEEEGNGKCDEDEESDDKIKQIQEQLEEMKKSYSKATSKKSNSNSIQSPQKTPVKASKNEWVTEGSLMVFTCAGVCSSSKIAGFDIDGTIICTKSGKVFAINVDDWKILFPEVKKKLHKLNDDGFKIVFITNQQGIGKGKVTPQQFKEKVEKIIKELDIPVQVFASTKSEVYRKPAPGMWDYLVEKCNDGIPVDYEQSLYVGDAAGREAKWAPGKKKDFSTSDRLFALNVGLKFFTPEEFFLDQKPAPFTISVFDPKTLKGDQPLCDPPSAKPFSESQEVVLLVGYPGSGKSHFVQQYLIPKGYVSANRDKVGTWQKCVSILTSSVKDGKSVVIDNTNPDKESRSRYLAPLKGTNIPCRCFIFNVDIEQAKHMNRFRELTDKSHMHVADMIMYSHRKKYEEPTLAEGFSEIVKINILPKFKTDEEARLFNMFLIEK